MISRRARAVCDALDVPLEVVPLTDAYWDLVVSHSIDEIARGRTPTPTCCATPAREVRGVPRGAPTRRRRGGRRPRPRREPAESGYAAMDRDLRRRARAAGAFGDARKDQTYFLAHLSQTQLRHLSFPVGACRRISCARRGARGGLPNADRKDSQGICFLGKVKFSEFVAEHLGEREGAIVELETGDLLGTHRGFWFHTIGQRSGLGLSGGPWYVAAKDVDGNVVSRLAEYYALEKRRNAFEVEEAFSWVSGTPPPRSRDGYAFGIKGCVCEVCEVWWDTRAVPLENGSLERFRPERYRGDAFERSGDARPDSRPGILRGHRDRGVLAAVRQDAARREPLRVHAAFLGGRRVGVGGHRARRPGPRRGAVRGVLSTARRASGAASSRRRRRTRRSSRGTRAPRPSSRGVRRIAEDRKRAAEGGSVGASL